MKFEDRMDKLYASDGMGTISDGSEISVPFTVGLNDSQGDALLVWKVCGEARITKLISVDKQNASVTELNAEQLGKLYALERLSYILPNVKNIDEYYECRDRYEELYCQLSNDPSLLVKYGTEMLGLLRYLFGDDMYEHLLMRIAEKYIDELRNANGNTEPLKNNNKLKN